MRICPQCGHKNDDVNFCGSCGHDLRILGGKTFCPYCGAMQSNPDNVLCCKCGKRMRGGKKGKYVWIFLALAIVVLMCCLVLFRHSGDEVPLETTCQHEWQNNGVTSICTKCRGVIITPSDADSSQKTDNQSVTIELVTAKKNQMSRDFIPPVPENLYPGTDSNTGYLCSITFVDTLEGIPSEYVIDVSVGQDGSVLAWYEIERGTGARNLYVGAEGSIIAPENCEALFSCNTYLEEIHFNNCFDTSNVTNMREMFGLCMALKELDLSCFDTSNVVDMSSMFWKTFSLKELDVSTFNTSSVTDMCCMFSQSALEEVDLSSFDTSKVTNMGGMFEKCGALKELDISNFVTSAETDIGAMFYQCYSLEKLDIRGFDLSSIPKEEIPLLLFMDFTIPKLFITNDNLMD